MTTVPYPNTEVWYLGPEPLTEAGACDYCPSPATVVVDSAMYVCVSHVDIAVTHRAEEHRHGYLIPVEFSVEPGGPMGAQEWVEAP
jgi:hypothetical protein